MKTATRNAKIDVSRAWSNWTGQMRTFTRMLDREGISYLSFSKVASVESCPQKYLLEYVEGVKLRPEPAYFLKGRLLHEAAAKLHRARRRGRQISTEKLAAPAERRLEGKDVNHVRNALALMQRLADPEWQVVAVEEGFVLDLGPDLPPCLGIVDLVQHRGNEYAVVDHKGGKKFNAPDRLQLVLYREYVRRQYGAERCAAYFDQYRWVNSLDRARKPAFCRTKVAIRDSAWKGALRRISARHRQMLEIEQTHRASATGDCMICPFRKQCQEATFVPGGRW